MIALWKRSGPHNLEQWGYVSSALLYNVPNLEPGQTWNVLIPPEMSATFPTPYEKVASPRTVSHFTVKIVHTGNEMYWEIVDGFKALAAFKHCATFPRARDV